MFISFHSSWFNISFAPPLNLVSLHSLSHAYSARSLRRLLENMKYLSLSQLITEQSCAFSRNSFCQSGVKAPISGGESPGDEITCARVVCEHMYPIVLTYTSAGRDSALSREISSLSVKGAENRGVLYLFN